jgi:hypothetical protein
MPAPVSPDADRLMKLAQAWVDRAVAVYAGDIPCNVSKYREAFREALFAAFQPDAGAMAEAEKIVDAWRNLGYVGATFAPVLQISIATALTRREAAGFARGVEAAIKAGDSVCDNDQCGLSQRQRAAMRALLGEGKE